MPPTPNGSIPLRNLNHERFCHEYLADPTLNGAASYRKVYGTRSTKVATANATRLLTYAAIRARLAALQQPRLKKIDVTAEKVLAELTRLGFSDVRRLLDDAGHLLPIKAWPDDIAASVASVEVVTKTMPGSGPTEIEYVTKIRLWDKRGSLELLGRHLRLFGAEPSSPQPSQMLTVNVTTINLDRLPIAQRRELLKLVKQASAPEPSPTPSGQAA